MSSSSSARGSAAKAQGTALEERVARLLRSAGWRVSSNMILRDRHGNRSEIDVVFGPPWWRTYVECKAYHGSGASVGLEEVAKFKEVLALNGLSPRAGLFITTTSFVPRALTTGVRTLDGAQFARWEARLRAYAWVRRVILGVGALALATSAITVAGVFVFREMRVDESVTGRLSGAAVDVCDGWKMARSPAGVFSFNLRPSRAQSSLAWWVGSTAGDFSIKAQDVLNKWVKWP